MTAIFINRTSLRGCIASNIPYPGGIEEDISYAIKESLPDHVFKITVTQASGGSMGHYNENIIVKFSERSYTLKDKSVKKVLTLEKIGEW